MDTLTQKPANAFSANTGPKRRDRTSRGTTVELLVQGAHCANCIAKIEKGLAKFDDVREVRFNLSTGKLTVRGDRGTGPSFVRSGHGGATAAAAGGAPSAMADELASRVPSRDAPG